MSDAHLDASSEVPGSLSTGDGPPAAMPGAVRYYALDAARGILMMLGIVLHTSNIYAPHVPWKIDDPAGSAFFDALTGCISSFRMPTFFWISGVFCAFTFERLGARGLLRERIPRLAVPLFSAWLFLNVPQELLLGWHYSIDPLPLFAHDAHLNHLWFLVDLLVYMGLAALLLPLLPAQLPRLPRWLEGSSALQVLLLAIATQLVVDAARFTGVGYAEPFGLTSLLRLAQFVPFFAAGILMYRQPSLREGFLSINPWCLLLAVPFAAVARELALGGGRLVHEMWILVASAASWICVAGMLGLFFGLFARESRVTRSLADASYTVYLFHHIVVIVLGIALLRAPIWVGVKFLIICVATWVTTLAIHFLVVRRVALLRYLFNGK